MPLLLELGYAPVNNEKIKFVAAAGIGADCFGYEMEHNGIRNIVDAVEFSAGIDLALIANLSDRIGIGFNVLGMAGFSSFSLFFLLINEVATLPAA